MTAPDASSPLLAGIRAKGTTLRLGLEGPVRPYHLPLLAACEWGFAAQQGLILVLDEFGDDDQPFASLERGEYDLVIAGPPHFLRPAASMHESIGCLVEIEGGVLMREDRLSKLRTGETVRVAATVRSDISDCLCRRIVQVWAGSQGYAVAETQIAVAATGPAPVDMLNAGYDALWPAFASVEAVAAQVHGQPVRMLTAKEAGFPGFGRYEIVARRRHAKDDIRQYDALVAALELATRRLQADPDGAVALWRTITGEADEVKDAIVRATVLCFKAPLDRDTTRQKALQAALQDL